MLCQSASWNCIALRRISLELSHCSATDVDMIPRYPKGEVGVDLSDPIETSLSQVCYGPSMVKTSGYVWLCLTNFCWVGHPQLTCSGAGLYRLQEKQWSITCAQCGVAAVICMVGPCQKGWLAKKTIRDSKELMSSPVVHWVFWFFWRFLKAGFLALHASHPRSIYGAVNAPAHCHWCFHHWNWNAVSHSVAIW